MKKLLGIVVLGLLLAGCASQKTKQLRNDNPYMALVELQKKGLNIRAIMHPTVEKGKERIRICIHSFNTEKEIKMCVSSLEKLIV